jgi:hypothetical protein
MALEIIAAVFGSVVTAVGGFEFIKWFAMRKTYERKKKAEVRGVELSLHERQIENYEVRLKQRDEKVDKIYLELRETQRRELTLIEKMGGVGATKQNTRHYKMRS